MIVRRMARHFADAQLAAPSPPQPAGPSPRATLSSRLTGGRFRRSHRIFAARQQVELILGNGRQIDWASIDIIAMMGFNGCGAGRTGAVPGRRPVPESPQHT
jgi:hypothetical protein